MDDGGRERRHWVERRVVDDERVKVLGLQARALHEALDAGVHDQLGLGARAGQRDLHRLVDPGLDGVGQESLLAEARDLDDLVHKVEGGLVVALCVVPLLWWGCCSFFVVWFRYGRKR